MTAAMPETGVLTGRQTRLAAALEEWPNRTVRLDDLWRLAAQADPGSVGRAEQRAELAEDLRTLAAAGLLSPSQTQDRTARPWLPRQVTLPAPDATPTAAAMARAKVWRPELAWVATARLTVSQVHRLACVNDWLRDRGRDTDRVPLRERSLEIFGHEKILDRLLGTSLFGPGRLTLDLLRTFRSHPPLPAVRVGPGGVLLVVENSDTFTTLLECVRREPFGIGWVAWGAGGAFEASVRTVPELRPAVAEVRYFGDLDFDGLRIPASAARISDLEQLPPVRPALRLYRQLLDSGAEQAAGRSVEADAAADLTRWLAGRDGAGTDIADRVAALLTTGRRLPQEAVGVRALTGAGWAGC